MSKRNRPQDNESITNILNLSRSILLDEYPSEIDELEQRLEMQIMDGNDTGALLCIWYVCSDVCPPGG